MNNKKIIVIGNKEVGRTALMNQEIEKFRLENPETELLLVNLREEFNYNNVKDVKQYFSEKFPKANLLNYVDFIRLLKTDK